MQCGEQQHHYTYCMGSFTYVKGLSFPANSVTGPITFCSPTQPPPFKSPWMHFCSTMPTAYHQTALVCSTPFKMSLGFHVLNLPADFCVIPPSPPGSRQLCQVVVGHDWNGTSLQGFYFPLLWGHRDDRELNIEISKIFPKFVSF